MVSKVFSVYDAKIGSYSTPFIQQTVGQALRAWIDVCNDKTTMFYKHPEDYTLFEIAEYDDETGKYNNLHTPKPHGLALEYKDKTQGL